ncbi:hypothetical protein PCL_09449 [Purpureocillium lilacinum]|uniref:Uncharacterized protein n=1 Tax=Purpureocillium lilacinum TaxID=33203 RepID=A0A2U3DQX7_PURLI|nr:hypothetical protein PCL_09449 [Purpureocillium lilacinum]
MRNNGEGVGLKRVVALVLLPLPPGGVLRRKLRKLRKGLTPQTVKEGFRHVRCDAVRCGAVPCAESRTRVLERQQQQQQQQQQQDPPNHGFALREPAREQNLEAKKARRRTHSGDTRRRTPINYGWGEGGHTRRAPGPPALRGGLPPGYYVSNQGQSNRLQVEGWSFARRPRTEDGAGSLPSVM